MFSVQKRRRNLGRLSFLAVATVFAQTGFPQSQAEDLRFSMPPQKKVPLVHVTGVKIKGGVVQAAVLERLLRKQLKVKISDTTVGLSVDDRMFNALERLSENPALQVMNVDFKIHPAEVRDQGFPISCRLYYAEEEMDDYAFVFGACNHLNRSFYLSRQAVFGKVVN